MAKLDTIYVDFDGRIARLNKKVDNAQKRIRGATTKMESYFKKMAATAVAAFSVHAITKFVGEAKNAARDAEEVSAKFSQVYASIQESAEAVAGSFSRSFDLATNTAKELLGTTGDLLVGFGFAEDKALELSKSVNELAVDLASFSNYSGGAEGASEALTKALLGETESAKSLGIVIRQNTEEFRNNVQAVIDTEGVTEQQAKAMVILDQAYTQSKKAVGDYSRTQNSLANQERALREQLKELSILLGEQLIPVFKTGTEFAMGFLRVFTEDTIERAIRRLSELGAEAETLNKIIETKTKLDTIKRLGELTEIAKGEATAFSNIFAESSKDIASLTDMLAIAGRADTETKEGMLQNRIDDLIKYYERLAEEKAKGENTDALEKLISKKEIEAEALQEMVAAQREINLLKEKENEIEAAGGDDEDDGYDDEAESVKNYRIELSKLIEEIGKLESADLDNTIPTPGVMEGVENRGSNELSGQDDVERMTQLYKMLETDAEFDMFDVMATSIETAHGAMQGLFEDLYISAENANSVLEKTFVGMANAFISQVQRMITEWLVFQALRAGLSLIPGGDAIVAALGSVGGRASGGPVQSNNPYIVGERGPELFVPSSSGMIVNNATTNNIMNNSNDVIAGKLDALNYNIASAMNGRVPVVIQLDGRTIAKTSESNLNTLQREGVNRENL